MRIALTGNPNSGKTTMYNALTGRSEKVGNWAGVTVERKEAPIKKHFCPKCTQLMAVDLPGAYSMSPFTSEENVTREYVLNERPDVLINIVDATNLSRSLFFTTQLLELGIPMVVALNKADVNERKHTRIDVAALSQKLGCPVMETVSTSHQGLHDVIAAAMAQAGKYHTAPYTSGEVDFNNPEAVKAADQARFEYVNEIVRQVEVRTVHTADLGVQDKIDAVITHPAAGIAIFAVVMWFVFWLSQASLGPWIADTFTSWLETFQAWVATLVTGASELWQSLLVDGVIGGVIAVVGFLPLVCVMYFLIALLEDCGYMARATVVLDPIFKKVGLSGKSVIPFVITTGCAIPGVMASRTVRNERERRATAMLAPFMPCGAKLPVIALFAGAFFPGNNWVAPAMYFSGIVLIFLGALLVNFVTGHKRKNSYFIIELPEYKLPSLSRAVESMLSRGWSYIVKAGTIILLCNTVVHLMQTFTWSFQMAETADTSILASIAQPFAYLLVPVVGIVSWRFAAAAITGFIAKENVVGTLAVCFVGLETYINMEELALIEGAGVAAADVMGIGPVAALAYLMFNLFTPPCFAAIGAMNSEMKSAKWLFGALGLQIFTGFTTGFLTYQVGTIVTTGVVGAAFMPGLVAVVLMAAAIVLIGLKNRKHAVTEGYSAEV